jgi:L-phenylalanine/L-methionine N-acetyltransferase
MAQASMSITIRRTSPQDAAALARLLTDPAVVGGTLQMPHANEAMWQARLSAPATPGSPDLSLVAELSGEIVGSAGLQAPGVVLRRRHVMGLGISVAPAAQRQGVGSALMAALCDYADNWLGILRIELTVYSDNEVAQRLYRKFGFQVEGTHRGYAMRDGVYVDAIAMARLHPKPPGIAPWP